VVGVDEEQHVFLNLDGISQSSRDSRDLAFQIGSNGSVVQKTAWDPMVILESKDQFFR